MTADEMEIAFRIVAGFWPNPTITNEEFAAWTRALQPLDLTTVGEVLEMVANSGRTFRPNAGEFVAEYRARTVRPKSFGPSSPVPELDAPRQPCGHPNNAVACPETVAYWLAECRAQLASATGPLAKALLPPAPTEETF